MLRRIVISRKRTLFKELWPIDQNAGMPPEGWSGWPEQKQFALVLTHDVETERGQEKCYQLKELEESLGFKSSFNFVPERYNVSAQLRHDLTANGFEVGVHGLYHDGKLFDSKKTFQERAPRINRYLVKWNSVGFRSPSMHHNLDWLHNLHIVYDSSTFDTDPFEPQPDGVRTIFPFYVAGGEGQRGYIELPYTLPQDFTLFVLMNEKNINIWKAKLNWIVRFGGMALFITHPDYMTFDKKKTTAEEYPAEYYVEFLEFIKHRFVGLYWLALPRQVAQFELSKLAKKTRII